MGQKRPKLSRLDFEQLSERNQMGLSQKELADFLSVATAQVGMSEAGIRSLPRRASQYHMLWKMAYGEAYKVFEDETKEEPISDKQRKKLMDEISDLRIDKVVLLRALDAMRIRNKKLKLLYAVSNRLLVMITDKESLAFSKVEVWLAKSHKLYFRFGRLPQARLLFRIDEIDRKIAFLEEFLN